MQSEVDGYRVTMHSIVDVSNSSQMEGWMDPPEDHHWSGPWEPIGVSGLGIVWRRPYTRGYHHD